MPTVSSIPATPAVHSSVLETVGSYSLRLLRSLPSGRYGTAYLAVNTVTGESLEIRHVNLLADADRDELIARRRLIGLLWHPTARRLRPLPEADSTTRLLLDFAGDESLTEWIQSSSASLTAVLQQLVTVAECLAEAHHLGLTHGDVTPHSITVSEGAPKLDFTGYPINPDRSQPRWNSLEAQTADCQALAAVAGWAFGLERYCAAYHDLRASHSAQLDRLQTYAANSATGERAKSDGATSDGAKSDGAKSDHAEMVRAEIGGAEISGTEGGTAEAGCAQADLAELDDAPQRTMRDLLGCLRQLITGQAPALTGSTQQLASGPVEPPRWASTAELPQPGSGAAGTAVLAAPAPDVNSPPLLRRARVGDQLGRYRLERKLGEGGMGAVFQATDLATQQAVAVKVLSGAALANPQAIRRFAKEARLLAALNNPYITNLLEVGEQNDVHYIALEFVDGVDLGKVLVSQRRLSERVALSIIADVARGLVEAHQREIIHRDIKPENILLLGYTSGVLDEQAVPRAKLADFGIARHIDETVSLALTQAGSLLGTPLYMSPEQCRGQGGIVPQSDIYSLGATLYHLLVGQPPFSADDPIQLVSMHLWDAPADIRQHVATLSQPVSDLVARCLAKNPAERFANAAQLLRETEKLLRGEVSSATSRPQLPQHDPRQVVESTMVWQLQSSAASLWPYVSNTERLNRAIGLPAVSYETEYDERLGVRRFGNIRLGGMKLRWEEHPFEWIEGRRMSVLREFSNGPFQWFVSTVELVPLPNGLTELKHTVKILPRNLLGRWLAQIETGKKCRRALERVYQRIDQTLSQASPQQTVDSFEPPTQLRGRRESEITQRIAELVKRGVSWAVAERMTEFLLHAPDQEVAKVRPIALARKWQRDAAQLDEHQVLDALLHGVVVGLFRLEWDLLCPTCRVPAASRPSLQEIAAHTHCDACHLDFKSDVANAVELVFRAHPDLRQTELGTYCIGGPWHAPHVVAQLMLPPHEAASLELDLSLGDYVLRGPQLLSSWSVRVQPSHAPRTLYLQLRPEGPSGPAADGINRTHVLRAGLTSLEIENHLDRPQMVRLERTLPRDDIFTAARAAATPRFRELFPSELVETGKLLAADQVTMLAAAISSIDELLLQCGDVIAFQLVERHLATAREVIQRFGGDVVRIYGETVFASFPTPLQATQAAFELTHSRFTQPDEPPLHRSVGIHVGPALITAHDSRLDYFGATARQAMALPGLCGAGVAITEPVTRDRTTAAWLAQHPLPFTLRQVNLPGRAAELIHFYAPATASHAPQI